MKLREFIVGVFAENQPGRKPKYSAYTTWYNPEWDGCCLHRVIAATGKEAKKIAIIKHKEDCMKTMR